MKVDFALCLRWTAWLSMVWHGTVCPFVCAAITSTDNDTAFEPSRKKARKNNSAQCSDNGLKLVLFKKVEKRGSSFDKNCEEENILNSANDQVNYTSLYDTLCYILLEIICKEDVSTIKEKTNKITDCIVYLLLHCNSSNVTTIQDIEQPKSSLLLELPKPEISNSIKKQRIKWVNSFVIMKMKELLKSCKYIEDAIKRYLTKSFKECAYLSDRENELCHFYKSLEEELEKIRPNSKPNVTSLRALLNKNRRFYDSYYSDISIYFNKYEYGYCGFEDHSNFATLFQELESACKCAQDRIDVLACETDEELLCEMNREFESIFLASLKNVCFFFPFYLQDNSHNNCIGFNKFLSKNFVIDNLKRILPSGKNGFYFGQIQFLNSKYFRQFFESYYPYFPFFIAYISDVVEKQDVSNKVGLKQEQDKTFDFVYNYEAKGELTDLTYLYLRIKNVKCSNDEFEKAIKEFREKFNSNLETAGKQLATRSTTRNSIINAYIYGLLVVDFERRKMSKPKNQSQ